MVKKDLFIIHYSFTHSPNLPIYHKMHVTGGRIPHHYQISFQVTEETDNQIVVQSSDEKSGFVMTIYLRQPTTESEHAIGYGEREVKCTMKWKDRKGNLEVHEGSTALYDDRSIRCDTRTCLEFWMELRP